LNLSTTYFFYLAPHRSVN